MDVLDQAQALFSAVAVMAASLTVLMDTLKPILFEALPDSINENVRVTIMRLFRLLLSVVFVGMSDTPANLIAGVPFLTNLPLPLVIFVVALLVSLGAEVSHQILDAITAIKDGLEGRAAERTAIAAERISTVNNKIVELDAA